MSAEYYKEIRWITIEQAPHASDKGKRAIRFYRDSPETAELQIRAPYGRRGEGKIFAMATASLDVETLRELQAAIGQAIAELEGK